MGNSSSQPETSGTTNLPELAKEPVRLCGTLPTDEVPAERYVPQLWYALDKTLENAHCGIGSDTPVGQGGTLDMKPIP